MDIKCMVQVIVDGAYAVFKAGENHPILCRSRIDPTLIVDAEDGLRIFVHDGFVSVLSRLEIV